VVHDLEVKALQIREVPWDMEREDLPLPVLRHLVPASEAFDDKAALGRAITLLDDGLVRTDVPGAKR